ncbi:MAG: hypothetical protein A2Y56_00035 [Candidatus Aminicenantes bacterium RBG_13_63_10]|nr:MAG: hypothetical protein A2Y56_00035 [Candidatus Aminicenantes bacterium RBG_13_63_10]
MRNINLVFLRLMIAAGLLAVGLPLQAQQASPEKIAGTWSVEIAVDTEAFFLSLTLGASGEGLEGSVSETYGSFTDLPITETVFDGTTLSFQFIAPTPPDGMERAVLVELKVVDESTMEGTLSVPDLGVAGQVKASKQ